MYSPRKNSTGYTSSGYNPSPADYEFTRANTISNIGRPPATPKSQYNNVAMSPRGNGSMPLVPPSTSSGRVLPSSLGMSNAGSLRSPRASYNSGAMYGGSFLPPGTSSGLPPMSSSGRQGGGMAATLGGTVLSNTAGGGLSPRATGSYIISNPNGTGAPIPTNKTTTFPLPNQSNFRLVDSRTEYKSTGPDYSASAINRLARAGSFIGNVERDGYGNDVTASPLPTFGDLPKNVTVPRPYPPNSHHPLNHHHIGRTLSTGATYNTIDQSHVPPRAGSALSMLEGEDKPVGPDNPTKALNDTWSACWDNEVNAVYYYNHQTEEATWILPEGL